MDFLVTKGGGVNLNQWEKTFFSYKGKKECENKIFKKIWTTKAWGGYLYFCGRTITYNNPPVDIFLYPCFTLL